MTSVTVCVWKADFLVTGTVTLMASNSVYGGCMTCCINILDTYIDTVIFVWCCSLSVSLSEHVFQHKCLQLDWASCHVRDCWDIRGFTGWHDDSGQTLWWQHCTESGTCCGVSCTAGQIVKLGRALQLAMLENSSAVPFNLLAWVHLELSSFFRPTPLASMILTISDYSA